MKNGGNVTGLQSIWASFHRWLLLPVSVPIIFIGFIMLTLPPAGQDLLVGHDLLVRLGHGAFIIAGCACSWLTYFRGAYRIGVAISLTFLLLAIARIMVAFS